jgi:hypothetical protein
MFRYCSVAIMSWAGALEYGSHSRGGVDTRVVGAASKWCGVEREWKGSKGEDQFGRQIRELRTLQERLLSYLGKRAMSGEAVKGTQHVRVL